jgi:hypothetical protein
MGGVCGEESAQGFGGKSRSKEATRKAEELMGGYQNGSWGIVVDSRWGPVGGCCEHGDGQRLSSVELKPQLYV